MEPSPTEPEAPWGRDLLVLLVVFGALLAWKLGSAPLANPDEGRYAEVPREMVASGDWVTPRLDGVPYFEKPPLVYWTVALCERFLGPSEWSLRLAPAAFALLGILCAYGAGRRLYGRDAGLWAALVLGTSLLYLGLSRLLILDMAVSVLMAATLFCFILAVREPPGWRRRWLYYGLYASAALATLSKGFIGFLVTGAVMFLWLVIFRQWRRLLPMHLPTGLGLFLALALPWHLLVNRANPGWAHFYIIYEHLQRYTETGHSRTGGFWYFIPVVILGMFPWTGFMGCSMRFSLKGGWARREADKEAWFLVLWAAFIFVFFSASQSKLIPYILPVFPPLAVLIGRFLAAAAAAPDGFEDLRIGQRVFAFLCGLLAAALCVMVLKPGLIRDANAAAALRPYAFIMAGILVLGGIRSLIPRGVGAERGRGALVAMTVTLVFLYGMLSVARPLIQVAVKPGTRDLASITRALLKPGDQVFHYHNYFQDFPYYAATTVGLVKYQDELELQFLDPAERQARFISDADFRTAWAGPRRVFAVARIRDVGPLFGDPAFHYHLLGEVPGHYLFSNQP